MPAYIVFSDSTLRDMARRRPSTVAGLLTVHGVGSKKAEVYGTRFIDCIASHCHAHRQDMDIDPGQAARNQFETAGQLAVLGLHPSAEHLPHWPRARELGKTSVSAAASGAFELFARGLGVEQVAEQLGRSAATVGDYLYQYVCTTGATDPSPWVAELEIERVEIAAEYALLENPAEPFRLKPVHTALHGAVGYTEIRVVLACRANRLAQAAASEPQPGR